MLHWFADPNRRYAAKTGFRPFAIGLGADEMIYGFPAIRGSTAKNRTQVRSKGGAAAFREIVRWLKDGNGVAILKFFGVSLAAFRIAGGILLFIMGLDMARNERDPKRERHAG